jgi:hypothetical protein
MTTSEKVIEFAEKLNINTNLSKQRFIDSVKSLVRTVENSLNEKNVNSLLPLIEKAGNMGLPVDVKSQCLLFSVYWDKNTQKEVWKLEINKDGLVTIMSYAGYTMMYNPVFKCDKYNFKSNGFEKQLEIESDVASHRTGDNQWVQENLVAIFVAIEKKSIGYREIVQIDISMLNKIYLQCVDSKKNKDKKPTQDGSINFVGAWLWLLQMYIKTAIKFAIMRAAIPLEWVGDLIDGEGSQNIKDIVRQDDIAGMIKRDDVYEEVIDERVIADIGNSEGIVTIESIKDYLTRSNQSQDLDPTDVTYTIKPIPKGHQKAIAAYFSNWTALIGSIEDMSAKLSYINKLLGIYLVRGRSFDAAIGKVMFISLKAISEKQGLKLNVDKKIYELTGDVK